MKWVSAPVMSRYHSINRLVIRPAALFVRDKLSVHVTKYHVTDGNQLFDLSELDSEATRSVARTSEQRNGTGHRITSDDARLYYEEVYSS